MYWFWNNWCRETFKLFTPLQKVYFVLTLDIFHFCYFYLLIFAAIYFYPIPDGYVHRDFNNTYLHCLAFSINILTFPSFFVLLLFMLFVAYWKNHVNISEAHLSNSYDIENLRIIQYLFLRDDEWIQNRYKSFMKCNYSVS